MNWYGFYAAEYADFGSGGKSTRRSPSDNFTQWIVTQSIGFPTIHFGKVSSSVQAYVYLIFVSQFQARSTIVSNWASAADGLQVFKCTDKWRLSYFVDIDRN